MRWPWESEADYKARLDARTKRIQARQQGRSTRVEARTGVKVAREEARAAGGYYDPASVAARQGTITSTIGAGLTAAEGVAQAFGYDVDLDGSALAPKTPAPATAMTPTSDADGTLFGMDRSTVLLAGVGIVALVVLMGRKS